MLHKGLSVVILVMQQPCLYIPLGVDSLKAIAEATEERLGPKEESSGRP